MDDEYAKAVSKSHELIEEARHGLLMLRREIEIARQTVARSLSILSRLQSSTRQNPSHHQ